MSQPLPARPDLEHLRKQAKALLQDLRARDPEAKLSEALHLVAHRYGFASWPRLKAHVRSIVDTDRAPDPGQLFAGRWIADVARSIRHPANQFQRAVLDITVTGNRVRIAHGYIDAAGRREHGVAEIDVDGRERVADNGYALTAAWRTPHVLETIATKGGERVGSGLYEVSPDGLTLTITGPEQVIVLVRG